jgi:site-specific DNA-adenine methylase
MSRAMPVISRPGGKGRTLKRLLPLIDGTPHKVYAGPCCGGAAVLPAKRPGYHEVLNDADGGLINLYRQVRFHLPAVIRELRVSVDSRRLFAESKGSPHATEIQRAAGCLCRNVYGFCGDAHSCGAKRLGRERVRRPAPPRAVQQAARPRDRREPRPGAPRPPLRLPRGPALH